MDTLAWSPDGQILAGGDGVTFWRADGSRLATHGRVGGRTNSVAWSPDGKLLATCGNDNLIRLWDPATGKQLRQYEGHTNWINTVLSTPSTVVAADVSRR